MKVLNSSRSKGFRTSEGIVSRSFIGKLSHLSNAVLDVHYFMYYKHEYDKEFYR
jgi:hypothetical protein